MEVWPNFFIVGAPKAGTTSLYRYLSKHSEIYMSPNKEPNYFSVCSVPENHYMKPIRDKNEYLSLFKKAKDRKIVGEGTTFYLSDPEASKLIHQIIPHARIIIMLRDPVERIFSQYLMEIRTGGLKLSFHEELQIELKHRRDRSKPILGLKFGLYSESVKRYLDIFGREQVKTLIFEEFTQNTKGTVKEILKFLGLNSSINNFDDPAHNPFSVARGPVAQYMLRNKTITKMARKVIPSSARRFLSEEILVKKPPKPKMAEEDMETLVKFYHDDVRRLQTVLRRKLPWTNF